MKPEWSYKRGLVSETRYHRLYRDNDLGVQLEVVTKRKNGFPVGSGKTYFYIDGDEREFKTEGEMLEALKEIIKETV